jgi:hypothetical protein
MEYGNLDSYLKAYDLLMAGLKKYPNNLIIMNNCVGLGTSLALPENGWIYAKERADEIASETIRQANYIISNSKDVNDVMRARQCLVFLYCAKQNFDLASSEARKFPIRTDFTVYSHMALVNRYMAIMREKQRICAATLITPCRPLKITWHIWVSPITTAENMPMRLTCTRHFSRS